MSHLSPVVGVGCMFVVRDLSPSLRQGDHNSYRTSEDRPLGGYDPTSQQFSCALQVQSSATDHALQKVSPTCEVGLIMH
jgi:hypothetical protein